MLRRRSKRCDSDKRFAECDKPSLQRESESKQVTNWFSFKMIILQKYFLNVFIALSLSLFVRFIHCGALCWKINILYLNYCYFILSCFVSSFLIIKIDGQIEKAAQENGQVEEKRREPERGKKKCFLFHDLFPISINFRKLRRLDLVE